MVRHTGDLTIAKADGETQVITTTPRTGMNTDLIAIGATYGMVKSRRGSKDPLHWSNDGY